MKNYELSANDENIKFTIEENILKRNDKLVNLIKLLDNIDDNFIISIDGGWGTGKTFFIKQLIYLSQHYEELNCFLPLHKELFKSFSKKHLVAYYNAWENDDHENPLESLIYNILNEYPKMKKEVAQSEELYNTSKKILINIVDKLTYGVIDESVINGVKSFEEFASNVQTIEEKKESLNMLFDNILKDDERILLIIDEVDRCRPDYAVKILETVKHFYNNKKITTIVVTNNVQLSSTIKHFYGNDFDGYGYLNKIYDTFISLETENLLDYVKNYCSIMKETNLPEDMSYLLFKHLKFTYRECNKYMSMYKISKPYIEYSGSFVSDRHIVESNLILPMTIALKIRDIELYNKFIRGEGTKFIADFIDNLPLLDKSNYLDWFNEILKVKEEENLKDKFIEVYKKIFTSTTAYSNFPYMEAISMLGNLVKYDD
jgi:KaiC/GvpD/RAD55 family RecA-like ATPase